MLTIFNEYYIIVMASLLTVCYSIKFSINCGDDDGENN